MPRRNREMTPEKIAKWIAEGRGQGRGKEYKPWLTIHDVPSRGARTRDKGTKTGRIHHLLSLLEYRLFLILEWCPWVIDFREQFPLLPLDETLFIAEQLGIRHPAIRGQPIVMTIDSMVTYRAGDQEIDQPLTCKYVQDLGDRREREKLEIARVYYKNRDADLKLVTERELLKPFADAVDLIWDHKDIDKRVTAKNLNIEEIAADLKTLLTVQNETLDDILGQCDTHFNLNEGTTLTIFYHMLATRRWTIDMSVGIDWDKPLKLI